MTHDDTVCVAVLTAGAVESIGVCRRSIMDEIVLLSGRAWQPMAMHYARTFDDCFGAHPANAGGLSAAAATPPQWTRRNAPAEARARVGRLEEAACD